MRCRALTATGVQCENRRAPGEILCTRHLNQNAQPRLVRQNLDDLLREQTLPRQPATPVPYEVVALVLRDLSIPREHILSVATDLSEAFRERDERFDARTFLRVATS